MSALPASHRGSGAGPALDVSHGETRSVQTAAGRPERGLLRVDRQVATTGLLIVLVLALLAAVPGLRDVLRELRHIAPAWIAAAVGLELASAISFVVVFRLFFDRLPARDARALAWAQQGSGALLPTGGAGGAAIGG